MQYKNCASRLCVFIPHGFQSHVQICVTLLIAIDFNARTNNHCLAICFLLELPITCTNVKKWLIKHTIHQHWWFLPESPIVTVPEVMQRCTWGFKAELFSVVYQFQILISLGEEHQLFFLFDSFSITYTGSIMYTAAQTHTFISCSLSLLKTRQSICQKISFSSYQFHITWYGDDYHTCMWPS